MNYASQTTVPADRSKNEIETLLRKYGADQFFSGWSDNNAVIGFKMEGKMVRFHLPLPKADDPKYRKTPSGRKRSGLSAATVRRAYEQEIRQRWRALLLVVKAKLEAVASGITSFEQEFLAHIVMVDGKTVAEWVMPQVNSMYQTGKMPTMLPGIGETSNGTP